MSAKTRRLQFIKNMFFIYLLILCISCGMSQTSTLYETKQATKTITALPFINIKCPSINFCIAVTADHTIFTTVNAGQFWEKKVFSSISFGNINCSNSFFCFSVNTDKQILVTTDGGMNWEVQKPSLPINSGYPIIRNISCPDQTFCLAIGAIASNSFILTTNDSGKSWKFFEVSQIAARELHCFTPTSCLAINGNTTYITRDGGRSWSSKIVNFQANASVIQKGGSLTCTNVHVCYVVGGGGTIASTQDGGQTWDIKVIETIKPLLVSYAAKDGQPALTTTEALRNFEFKSVSCYNALICIATGNQEIDAGFYITGEPVVRTGGGILVTTVDGGNSWQVYPSKQALIITSLSCPSSYFCTATDGAHILTSKDQGLSWEIANLPV